MNGNKNRKRPHPGLFSNDHLPPSKRRKTKHEQQTTTDSELELADRWNVVKKSPISTKEYNKKIYKGNLNELTSQEVVWYWGSIQQKATDIGERSIRFLSNIIKWKDWNTFEKIAAEFKAEQYRKVTDRYPHDVVSFFQKPHKPELDCWIKLLANEQFNDPIGLAARGEWVEFKRRLDGKEFKRKKFRKKIKPLVVNLQNTDADTPSDNVSVFSILFHNNKFNLLHDVKQFLLQDDFNVFKYMSRWYVDQDTAGHCVTIRLKKSDFFAYFYDANDNLFRDTFTNALNSIRPRDMAILNCDIRRSHHGAGTYKIRVDCNTAAEASKIDNLLQGNYGSPAALRSISPLNNEGRARTAMNFFDQIARARQTSTEEIQINVSYDIANLAGRYL